MAAVSAKRGVQDGPGEPPSWVCDPYIRNWLLDISNLDKSLVGIAKVQDIKPPLSNWHIKEAVDFVKQSLAAGGNMPIRFFVAVLGSRALAVVLGA